MDILIALTAIVAVIAGITLFGFLIVLVVGVIIKNPVTKKVGKIGLGIAGTILIISTISNLGFIKIEEKQQAEIAAKQKKIKKAKDKKFIEIANKITGYSTLIVLSGEDVTKKIHDGWGDAIDNSGSAEDFDVDTVVSGLVSDNNTSISTMHDNLNDIDSLLSALDKNDTGQYEYDSDFYSKMYDHASDYVDFIENPSGSYLDYIDSANKYHEKISDDINEVS